MSEVKTVQEETEIGNGRAKKMPVEQFAPLYLRACQRGQTFEEFAEELGRNTQSLNSSIYNLRKKIENKKLEIKIGEDEEGNDINLTIEQFDRLQLKGGGGKRGGVRKATVDDTVKDWLNELM